MTGQRDYVDNKESYDYFFSLEIDISRNWTRSPKKIEAFFDQLVLFVMSAILKAS